MIFPSLWWQLSRLRYLIVVLGFIGIVPAFGPRPRAADRIEMLASAAQTASGVSAAFKVSTFTQAVVGVDITAGSGTVADFDLWLECSDDGGTTWYAVAPNVVVTHSTRAASWTTDADDAYIVDSKATTTAEKYFAQFQTLSCDYVRLEWTHTGGSSPSLTLSVSMVGK